MNLGVKIISHKNFPAEGRPDVPLKSVEELRDKYFFVWNDPHKPRWLPFWPRPLNWLYAKFNFYFWMPCHICGTYSGGHEWYGSDDNTMSGICPKCVLKTYNETGEFNIKRKAE